MDGHGAQRREEWFWGLLVAALSVQLAAVVAAIRQGGVVVPLSYGLGTIVEGIVVPLGAAMALRAVLRAVAERSVRRGLRTVLDQWWEYPFIVLSYVLLAEAYVWGKVFVPAINPRTWDGLLAAVDRFLCLGVDPNVALLTIFEGARPAAVLLDRFYGLFVPSMLAVTAWFSTDRPARRKGFFLAVSIVWSLGLWLYIAVPARGPVFVQSRLWHDVSAVFPIAASTQLRLLENFRSVMAVLQGRHALIAPTLGIGAMPSLHVAAQALFFLWCVRLRTRWRTVFLVLTGLTFLGAVATGWHWAVDGWAGIVLAVIASIAGWRTVSMFEGRGPGAGPRQPEHARGSPETSR